MSLYNFLQFPESIKHSELNHYQIRLPYMACCGETSVSILDRGVFDGYFTHWKGLLYAVGQLEISDSGYKHWQIHLVFKNGTMINTKIVRELFFGKHKVNIYVRKAIDPERSMRYVTKDTTRADGPYEWRRDVSGIMVRNEVNPLKPAELKHWWDKYIEHYQQTHNAEN